MRKGVYILLILAAGWAHAQEKEVEKSSSIKAVAFGNYDPFLDTNNQGVANPFKPYLSQQFELPEIGYNIGLSSPEKQQLHLFPVVNQLFSSTQQEDGFQSSFRTGAGIGATYNLGEKFYVRGVITANYYERDQGLAITDAILPNSYLWNGDEVVKRELDPKVRASYTPNKFFNFQVGVDQNFFGEGARSLVQGDHVPSAPFGEIRSTLWKFEFVNRYQLYREKLPDKILPKYASTHFLNINLTDRFQFGVFESVMFMPKDDELRRGFEIDYLNPFLFYRPQAYSIGSQDRLVVGAHFSYSLSNFMVYGQFLLDEFVLGELRNRTRWWGNKHAGQIGFKGKYVLQNTLLTYRSELNYARPFTFSHLNPSTTYGFQGIPLGHPLGANFVESLTSVSLGFKNSLTLTGTVMFAQQGGMNSEPGLSFGNNIFAPYVDRPYDYGFFIGGDGKLNRLRMSLELNYEIHKKMKLQAFIRPIYEIQSGAQNRSYILFFGGLRTNLWNERSFDF